MVTAARVLLPRDSTRANAIRRQLYDRALALLKPKLQVRAGDFFEGDGMWARAIIELDNDCHRARFASVLSEVGALLQLAGVDLPPSGANGRVALMMQSTSMAVRKHSHPTNGERGIIGRLCPAGCELWGGAFMVEHDGIKETLRLGNLGLGEFNPHWQHWREAGAVGPMVITFTVYTEAVQGGPTETAREWIQGTRFKRRVFLVGPGRLRVVLTRLSMSSSGLPCAGENPRVSADTPNYPPAKYPRFSLDGRPKIQVTFSPPSGATAAGAIDLT